MTRFCTRNIPTLFGLQFLSSVVSVAKNCFGRVLTTFSGLSPTRTGKAESRVRKTRFAPETYPHNLWWYSYRFQSVQLTNVSAEFWRLFHGTTIVGQVENLVRKTRFCTRNIPTLFGVQFLSFHVSTVEKCFGRVLTTFPVWAPLEQEKLKTGPRWLGLPPETYPHFFWGANLIVSHEYGQTTFWNNFDHFSGPRYNRSRPGEG